MNKRTPSIMRFIYHKFFMEYKDFTLFRPSNGRISQTLYLKIPPHPTNTFLGTVQLYGMLQGKCLYNTEPFLSYNLQYALIKLEHYKKGHKIYILFVQIKHLLIYHTIRPSSSLDSVCSFSFPDTEIYNHQDNII